MLADVDLATISKTAFHLFGNDGGGGEASDQLLAALAAAINAALIDEDRTGDVTITAGDQAATVNIRQDVMTVAD